MNKGEDTLKYIVLLLLGYAFGIVITMTIIANIKTKDLENEVVEAYDKGYLDGENHALIYLMEDYYDILIENAILNERLKNQPSNEEYIERIIDDFELVIELQQYYYQENITSHNFGDWLQINYPALYKRLLNYFKGE
jgi:hypothetical protein